ncbi:MAG: BREX system ATP-binding domain-containing protein [Thermomicrobiales bacterium]
MTAAASWGRADPNALRDILEQIAQYGIVGGADARLVDVGSEDYVACFAREVLDGLLPYSGATCRFFEGSYGSGKTHLLRLLEVVARERGLAVVRTELTHDLGLGEWRPIAQHIFTSLEMTIAGNPRAGLPAILTALRNDHSADADALRAARLPHAGFQAAMLRAVTVASIPLPLRRFLNGERVRVADLGQAGVVGVKDSLSPRNAELALVTVLGGLAALGLPGTLLLFDENESSFFAQKAPTRKLKTAANIMRRLVDGCTTGSLMGAAAVFAVLPGFLNECARQYPALGQRLEMPPQRDGTAWRWPVLPVTAVTSLVEPEDFLDAVRERLAVCLAGCGCDPAAVAQATAQMDAAGAAVLAEHVGSGYRRPLMKRLATIALATIEGVDHAHG